MSSTTVSRRRCAVAVFGVAVCLSLLAASSGLTPAQKRGKQIFDLGTSASGKPISARLQSAAEAVPAGLVPCAGCHGPDGLGKPEGGVVPSDITWDTLTKPYDLVTASGRRRPPYNEKLLKRAITLGFDSAGNPLDLAMPRFQLTAADADDLVAYIRRLGDSPEPGLTDTAIRIGVLLPPGDRAVWTDFFDGLNRDGGIYGRRIESVFLDATDPAALQRETVFALVADDNLPGGAAIPSFVISPDFPDAQNSAAFYLDTGVAGEVAALCAWMAGQPRRPGGEIAVVVDRSELSVRLLALVRQKFSAASLPPPVELAPGDFAAAHEGRFSAVLWLSPAVSPLHKDKSQPYPSREVLLPGKFAPRSTDPPAAPPDFHFIVASSAVTPFQPARAGARTAVAAVVITEALQRVGRQLSRAAFVSALESVQNFESGVLAPLSFSANRHYGVEAPTLYRLRPGPTRWEFELMPR